MAHWMTKNFEDALISGEYDLVSVDEIILGGVTVVAAAVLMEGLDATSLLASPDKQDHYMCPGCGHWRIHFGLVDCRHLIDPVHNTNGKPWMCDGCWTGMIFRAAHYENIYRAMAADVIEGGGPHGKRQEILRKCFNRMSVREPRKDRLIDVLADVMLVAPSIFDIDKLAVKPDILVEKISAKRILTPDQEIITERTSTNVETRLNSKLLENIILQHKINEGFTITRSFPGCMPLSVWNGLHGAPQDFINKSRGKPADLFS